MLRPMGRMRSQADLVYLTAPSTAYVAVVAEVPKPPRLPPKGWLGVDPGIVHLATDSDGATYSGGHLNGLRNRHTKLRERL